MSAEINLSFSDEPFDGCAKSVLVTLTDPHGKHQEHYQLGVLSADEIYNLIESGGDVNLDHRFIDSFSLNDYRKTRNLSEDTEVEIRNISAKRTFFQGLEGTDFSHGRFTGERASFAQCVFGDGPLSFYSCSFRATETDFGNSHFGAGKANFQYAEFLSETTSFNQTNFETGDVLFVNCTFGDSQVSFKEVNFGQGRVDFHYTKFGDGNLTFDKAQFGGGEVSFKRVDFGHGKVDFKRVNFGDGEIDFSESEFKSGKVVFKSTVFGKGNINFQEVVSSSDFIFDNAEFGSGSLSFLMASARKLSFKLCHLNNYIDLRIKEAQKVDLSYTIVRDIVDMMPTERAPVAIEELTISGMRNLGNLYIDWEQNNVLSLILSQKESTDRQKSEQFLILKETYDATGRYADEDKAYIWYKRLELKADLKSSVENNSSSAIWAYPTAFFKWLLFDKIGLYATEPLRVLFSVTVIYTLFSLSYLVLPLIADTYIDTGGSEALSGMNAVSKSFYFSAITFLTVGYGDFYPVGIMRVLASIEGYVGVFLMGYFSVAFVRKVLR